MSRVDAPTNSDYYRKSFRRSLARWPISIVIAAIVYFGHLSFLGMSPIVIAMALLVLGWIRPFFDLVNWRRLESSGDAAEPLDPAKFMETLFSMLNEPLELEDGVVILAFFGVAALLDSLSTRLPGGLSDLLQFLLFFVLLYGLYLRRRAGMRIQDGEGQRSGNAE